MTSAIISDTIERMDKEKDFLTTGEVSALLGASKQWISHLCREGALKSYRLQASGWHRITRKSLEEYIEHFSIPVDWDVLNK